MGCTTSTSAARVGQLPGPSGGSVLSGLAPSGSAQAPSGGPSTADGSGPNLHDLYYTACHQAAASKTAAHAKSLPVSTGRDVQCLVDPLTAITADDAPKATAFHQVVDSTSATPGLDSAVLSPYQAILASYAHAAYAKPGDDQPYLLVAVATPKPEQSYPSFATGILDAAGATDVFSPTRVGEHAAVFALSISCGHDAAHGHTLCAWTGKAAGAAGSADVPLVGVLVITSTVPADKAEQVAEAVFEAVSPGSP